MNNCKIGKMLVTFLILLTVFTGCTPLKNKNTKYNEKKLLTSLLSNNYQGVIEATENGVSMLPDNLVQSTYFSDKDRNPLSIAVENYNLDICKYLIGEGADVNYIGESGLTYLMYAAMLYEMDMCRILLDGGADINKTGTDKYKDMTSLDIALLNIQLTQRSEYDILNMLEYLIANGASITDKTFFVAMTECNYSVIKEVFTRLEPKEDNTEIDKTVKAAINGDSDIVISMVKSGKINDNYENKVLFYTAAFCNKEALKTLLESGFDITECDEEGNSLLSIAAGYNNTDVVNFLLEQGLDSEVQNTNDIRPLEKAIINCKFDNAKLLMDKNSPLQKKDTDILELTIQYGNIESVRFLMENGYIADDKSYNKEMFNCLTENRLDVMEYLLKDVISSDAKVKLSENIITVASFSSSACIVEKLIEYGFPICNDSLVMAIENRKWDTVTLLIEKGADVNIEINNSSGYRTPLSTAIKYGNMKIVKLLVEKGADVNYIGGDGLTPLIHAASSPSVEIVRFLLSQGANINYSTQNGKTALSYAKDKKWDDIINLLK